VALACKVADELRITVSLFNPS